MYVAWGHEDMYVGFSKDSLKLIYNYIKGRNQRVKINAEYSSWKEILKGVLQGSVLGPLLFNIFINDLFFFVEKSEVCNYADDNSLTVADICVDTIISKLEKDINNLDTWFKHNGMVLNKIIWRLPWDTFWITMEHTQSMITHVNT